MSTGRIVTLTILCLILPAGAFAQGYTQGDKTLQLSMNGASDKDFDNTIFSITGELGYFATPNIQAALRQGVRFSDIEGGGSTTNASTVGAVDYNFDMGRLWPFGGVSVGYVYGGGVADSWEMGLEGGASYFVNTTTFILGRIEYQWFLDNNSDGGFEDGQWVYTIGIGFRW